MKPLLVCATAALLATTVFGYDAANFSLWDAAGACLVVTGIVAVVLVAAVVLPGFALWGGATFIGTSCAIGLVSLTCGVLAGTYFGLREGESRARQQAEQNRLKRMDDIRSISSRIDMYFEPREDDAGQAKDFVCWFVIYDEMQPEQPETKEQITGRDADEFYDRCRGYLDHWLTLRLARDEHQQAYELHVFMEQPFPGDGTYVRIESIADQLQLDTKRHDVKWTSAVQYLTASPPQRP